MALDTINDIINLLDSTNKNLESKIKIASNDAEITVRAMNAHHSKNIIKSAIDGPFATTQFNLVMYSILQDVVDAPLKSLNIYDKVLIMLQLREKNVGDVLEIDLYNEDESTIKYKLNIAKHVAKMLKEKVTFEPRILDIDSFAVSLKYPNIEEEFKFEDNFYKTKLSVIDEKNDKSKRALIAPMFINNIAQYVDTVTIAGQLIDLGIRSINERLAIVEKLPALLMGKIIKSIDADYGKPISKLVAISTLKDGKEYSGTVDINAGLFLVN